MDICEKLDRCLSQQFGIEALGQDVAHRIGAACIEIIGREDPRHKIQCQKDRRRFERPLPDENY